MRYTGGQYWTPDGLRRRAYVQTERFYAQIGDARVEPRERIQQKSDYAESVLSALEAKLKVLAWLETLPPDAPVWACGPGLFSRGEEVELVCRTGEFYSRLVTRA